VSGFGELIDKIGRGLRFPLNGYLYTKYGFLELLDLPLARLIRIETLRQALQTL
jgi:hypothetical protein